MQHLIYFSYSITMRYMFQLLSHHQAVQFNEHFLTIELRPVYTDAIIVILLMPPMRDEQD
jgi:hypothetical protein